MWFEPFKTGLSHSGLVCVRLELVNTGSSRSGPVLASLDGFDLVKTGLRRFRPVSAGLVGFEPVKTGLSRSGLV